MKSRFYSYTLSSMLLLASVASAVVPATAAETNVASFSDVSAGHYAAQAIARLKQLGTIEGEADGTLRPDEPITRGLASLWLSRTLKLGDPASVNGFADVPADSKYAKAVNALREKRIAEGSAGLFHPDDTLTREQMASLLVRAFELKDNGVVTWFTDEAAISEVHFKDVVRLKQHFITDQLEFMPASQVTRAQMAVFLYRAATVGETAPNEIPLNDFLRMPEKTSFRHSPDDKKIAMLEPWNNRMNISVQIVGEKETKRVTSSTDRDVTRFTWINNDTLLYLSDDSGNEDFHLHAVEADGSGDRDLTPYPRTRVELVDTLTHKQGHEYEVLVSMNKRNPKEMDLYRLNFKTGELQLEQQNPGTYTRWITDNYADLRMVLASDGERTKVLYRQFVTAPFETVLTVEPGDTFIPVMFTFDNRQIYALSDIGRDKQGLVAFNPETKQVTETIYVNTDADVTDVIVSYKKGAILAVEYETDKPQLYFMDKEYETLYKQIQSKLPGKTISITGNPFQEKVTLVAYSDKSPGANYTYNTKTEQLDKVADLRPWLDESKMAEMKPISYTSRDGLTIHGYLTLPKQGPAKSLPVVVLPHGGPWARDSWGYSSEVQLLADRGYAVLQMNFRGSTGYGKSFLNAGNKQWGRTMQNDITDGVQWLIKQGIADPQRIAIYGASYGGYATLAGVTFTPDLYAAGIDYVGPSNLFTFLNTMPAYWEPDRQKIYSQVGDPVKDKELLEQVSPLHHADQIRVPLMIAQGANDPRIKKAESDQIVMALRARGIDSPYMVKNNEGHGFHNLENQTDFYRALLKFLDKNVKNRG